MFKFEAVFKGRVTTMKDFEVALTAATSATARETANRLKDTTKTWDHKPNFRFRKVREDGRIQWEAFCVDEIYYYVNMGTEPHPIFPKKLGGVLAFQSMYGAKTRPGFIGSFPGGSRGDMVFAKYIPQHPGTDARRFDIAVALLMQRKYKETVQRYIKEVAEK